MLESYSIVPIYDVGEQDCHHFYAMGFVEGSMATVAFDNLSPFTKLLEDTFFS